MFREFRRLLCAGISLLFSGASALAGGWYVGDTQPGEWIEYQAVKLAAGPYRFTARMGAEKPGATVHLEVDGKPLGPPVAVPVRKEPGIYAEVHLGAVTLPAGAHDLKFVFDSGGVELDWFMLTKDPSTSPEVLPVDTRLMPPPSDGMLLGPVTGFEHKTGLPSRASEVLDIPGKDEKGNPYSEAQLTTWYSVPMYRDYDRRTDRYWDALVDELMLARAQVPLFHCRETIDQVHGLQERAYEPGGGSYEGRWLVKLVEAIARNPQAQDALKIGMFWENGGTAKAFAERHGYAPGWGDYAFLDYVLRYWLEPWFDSVRAELLFQPTPGRPIISIYAGNPDGIVQDGRMGEFLAGIRTRLKTMYGLDPLFVLPMSGGVDAEALKQAWGQSPWVTWDGPLIVTNSFNGTVFGTASSGSRRRIDTVFLNDWDPVTGKGSPGGDAAGSSDSHQPRVDARGEPSFRAALAEAKKQNARFIQEEGFTNISEGNSIFRSFHPEWKFPNQHLGVMREFADPGTQSLKFEAEACDAWSKTRPRGNRGGTFRRQWYSPTDISVFRPLHHLLPWRTHRAEPPDLAQISAGFFDAWAVDESGNVWAQPIDGESDEWMLVTAPGPVAEVALWKFRAWILTADHKVLSAKRGYPAPANGHFGWTEFPGPPMKTISAGASDIWALDDTGKLHRAPVDGEGTWTPVAGPALDSIAAGDAFLWGIGGGKLHRAFLDESSVEWTEEPNPRGLGALAVGSDEVWGIDGGGALFRRSSSGAGDWEPVEGRVNAIAVGEDYAWALAKGVAVSRELEGFVSGEPLVAPVTPKAESREGGVALSWPRVTGATGYFVQRAPAKSGPWTTIASPGKTHFTDASAETTAWYRVCGIAAAQTGPPSPPVSAGPSARPEAPVALGATRNRSNHVLLRWKGEPGASTEIERRVVGEDAFRKIARVTSPGSFLDTSSPAHANAFYRLRSLDANDMASGWSNEVFCVSPSLETLRFNFQPGNSRRAAGVLVADGSEFQRHANGFSYGWDGDAPNMRERREVADVVQDTMALARPGPRWVLALPNGKYRVVVTVGDPTRDSLAKVAINGAAFGEETKVTKGRTADLEGEVMIRNGRLEFTIPDGVSEEVPVVSLQVTTLSAPSVPGHVAAIPGDGQVTVTWDPTPFARGYVVRRADARGGGFVKGPVVQENRFVDQNAPNGGMFAYVVSAVNSVGVSPESPPTVAKPGPDQNAITLKARINGRYISGTADAPLIASSDSVGMPEIFVIEHLKDGNIALKSQVNGRYVTAGGKGEDPLSATGTSLAPGATFHLEPLSEPGQVALRCVANGKLVSADDAGRKPLKCWPDNVGGWEAFEMKPVASPEAPVAIDVRAGDGEVRLSWPAVHGAQAYLVRRSTARHGEFSPPIPVRATEFVDRQVKNGETCFYAVASSNAYGAGNNSATVMGTPHAAPAAPLGVRIVHADSGVRLEWSPVPGAGGYNVKRRAEGDTDFATLGSAREPRFVDEEPSAGSVYTVTAFGPSGESASSSAEEATP